MTVYITGVSSGIGKSLATSFLEIGATVVGIGRKSDIKAEKYSFSRCDLRSAVDIEKLHFKAKDDLVILINNAGIIGTIDHFSELSRETIQDIMYVNTIAPLLLINKFLNEQSPLQNAIIVNISSGAASKSIASWSTYCASKAAIDRFSETLQVELEEKKRPVKVYSIAPGVVDTPMQNSIRKVSKEKFSSIDYFQELKSTNLLTDPTDVARKILKSILDIQPEKVLFSLREID